MVAIKCNYGLYIFFLCALTVRVFIFVGLNFCGLNRQDDFEDLYFHGILWLMSGRHLHRWNHDPRCNSVKFQCP